MKYTGFDGEG